MGITGSFGKKPYMIRESDIIMTFYSNKYQIIKKSAIAKDIYDYTVKCPEVSAVAKAGQFLHIKADGFYLRRPISICEINKSDGTIRFVFEIRGEGTEQISGLGTGDIIDLIAPLGGRGFTLRENTKSLAVGGGIGVPPLLELAGYYGENLTAVLGFRSYDKVILTDDFKTKKSAVIVCTDDGTIGNKGVVTPFVEAELQSNKPGIIYACGPEPMIKAVVGLAEKYDVDCEVSLEQRMACGVGACLVCACKTVKDGKDYYAHVCSDGPVFDSNEVLFEK